MSKTILDGRLKKVVRQTQPLLHHVQDPHVELVESSPDMKNSDVQDYPGWPREEGQQLLRRIQPFLASCP